MDPLTKTEGLAEPQYVKITPEKVYFNFHLFYEQDDKGRYIASIPAYGLHLYSDTKEGLEKNTNIMINSFYDYWLMKKGWKGFILKLHRLGFRAEQHQLAVYELLQRKRSRSQFKFPDISVPEGMQAQEMSLETPY